MGAHTWLHMGLASVNLIAPAQYLSMEACIHIAGETKDLHACATNSTCIARKLPWRSFPKWLKNWDISKHAWEWGTITEHACFLWYPAGVGSWLFAISHFYVCIKRKSTALPETICKWGDEEDQPLVQNDLVHLMQGSNMHFNLAWCKVMPLVTKNTGCSAEDARSLL